MEKDFIDKKMVGLLKGIALIFMFIHHLFGFPERIVEGGTYSYLNNLVTFLRNPTQICVAIFAFLTGYTYYRNKKYTYKYSIKKCFILWINYFILFLIMYIPAVGMGLYQPSVKMFLFEAFALYGYNLVIMYFCWYVLFYFIVMFLLPLYAKASLKNPVITFILSCCVVPILQIFVKCVGISEYIIISNCLSVLDWLPCVTIGFLFAQLNIYDKFPKFENINKFIKISIYIVLLIIGMWCRIFGKLDFIYITIVVFSLVRLLNPIKNKKILIPLTILAKHSMLIWFTHCIFFNIFKNYTQWFLYLPREPLLVTLWGLFICLTIAWIISSIINLIIKVAKKIVSSINKNKYIHPSS